MTFKLFFFFSYRENALRLSKLVRLRPRPPVSEAADWVEYVLAVGGLSHLRPACRTQSAASLTGGRGLSLTSLDRRRAFSL